MADIIKQSNLNKARLDKFILSFSVPDCLKGISTREERAEHHKSGMRVVPDDLQYSIYGAVVPEVEIPSIVIAQFGQHLKASSHRRAEYTDVTVNFNVDNEFNNYWYIFRWLDIMNDQKTAIYDDQGIGTVKDYPHQTLQEGTPGYDEEHIMLGSREATGLMLDYQTDFTLFGLNEYNKEVVKFIYLNAFPTNLGEISFNYQDASEVSSSFTFSFSQLQVELM